MGCLNPKKDVATSDVTVRFKNGAVLSKGGNHVVDVGDGEITQINYVVNLLFGSKGHCIFGKNPESN